MRAKIKYEKDEKFIALSILEARKVQEFIIGDMSAQDSGFSIEYWRPLFQKRVDTIAKIKTEHPSAIVELRKRLLQQAALSIRALVVLENCKELSK